MKDACPGLVFLKDLFWVSFCFICKLWPMLVQVCKKFQLYQDLIEVCSDWSNHHLHFWKIVMVPEALPDVQPAGSDHGTLWSWTLWSAAPPLPGDSNGGRSAGQKRREQTEDLPLYRVSHSTERAAENSLSVIELISGSGTLWKVTDNNNGGC